MFTDGSYFAFLLLTAGMLSVKTFATIKCDKGGKCSCNLSVKRLHEKFEVMLDDLISELYAAELFELQMPLIYPILKKSREEFVINYKGK